MTVTFTAPCPVCHGDATWTETQRERPEHSDNVDIDCPVPCRCDLPGLTCTGPPPGQAWCLARDREEWRRWLTGRLRTRVGA